MNTQTVNFDEQGFSHLLENVFLKEEEHLNDFYPKNDDDIPLPLLVPVALHVRAPDNNFKMVMDECLTFLRIEFLNNNVPYPEMGIYSDIRNGIIHVSLTPNMIRSIGSSDDLFWKLEESYQQ